MIEFEAYLDSQPVVIGDIPKLEIDLPRTPEFSVGRVLGDGDAGPVGFDLKIGKWQYKEAEKICLGELILQRGFRPHYLFVPVLGKQLLEKLYEKESKYKFWFDFTVFIKHPRFDEHGNPVRDKKGQYIYEITSRSFVLAPIRVYDIAGEYLGDIEINEDLPLFIEQKTVYLVLLASLPHFINQTLCTLGYDQIADFRNAFYLAFSRSLYNTAVQLYLEHLEINLDEWETLIQWAENDVTSINPGQPFPTTTSSTTTTFNTTTTEYVCREITTPPSTTTTITTSTTTTTTLSPIEICSSLKPAKRLWYVNGWPTGIALDAFLSQICRYAWIERYIYVLPISDDKPLYIIADEEQPYKNLDFLRISRAVIYFPECDSFKGKIIYPVESTFQTFEIPIRSIGNHYPIIELGCCSPDNKSCLYDVVAGLWNLWLRKLPHHELETRGFVLDIWERLNYARINLKTFQAEFNLFGISSLPTVYARVCDDQTTTTAFSSTPYIPEDLPPDSPLHTTTTKPPCIKCICKVQCNYSEDNPTWVMIYSECEDPCRCPIPKKWEYECNEENDGEILTISCTDTEESCDQNYAEWQWTQTGDTYSEGHWVIKTPCPDGCHACYPDFCCEDEMIDGEYECQTTWTQCVDDKEKCPNKDGETWPRDCRACRGDCSWIWDGENLIEQESNCEGVEDCQCCPPTVAELQEQHNVDRCEDLPENATVSSKCGTDSQCKERGELADCAKKCDGKCVWRKSTGGQIYLESDECVQEHGKECRCCPPTADQCQETQPGHYIETECRTDCKPEDIPEDCFGLERCPGECQWEYLPNVGWILYEDSVCPDGCDCCWPDKCEPGIIKTKCYRNLNRENCTGPDKCPNLDGECICTTSSSTTTTRPQNCDCRGLCRWYSYHYGPWIKYSDPCCFDCPCLPPARMPRTQCDYEVSHCILIITTTTPPPLRGCYGVCYWHGIPVSHTNPKVIWVLNPNLSWCSTPLNNCRYIDECNEIQYISCHPCACEPPSQGTRLQCKSMCIFECINGVWVKRLGCDTPLCNCEKEPTGECNEGAVVGYKCTGIALDGECGEIVVTGCSCKCVNTNPCWRPIGYSYGYT